MRQDSQGLVARGLTQDEAEALVIALLSADLTGLCRDAPDLTLHTASPEGPVRFTESSAASDRAIATEAGGVRGWVVAAFPAADDDTPGGWLERNNDLILAAMRTSDAGNNTGEFNFPGRGFANREVFHGVAMATARLGGQSVVARQQTHREADVLAARLLRMPGTATRVYAPGDLPAALASAMATGEEAATQVAAMAAGRGAGPPPPGQQQVMRRSEIPIQYRQVAGCNSEVGWRFAKVASINGPDTGSARWLDDVRNRLARQNGWSPEETIVLLHDGIGDVMDPDNPFELAKWRRIHQTSARSEPITNQAVQMLMKNPSLWDVAIVAVCMHADGLQGRWDKLQRSEFPQLVKGGWNVVNAIERMRNGERQLASLLRDDSRNYDLDANERPLVEHVLCEVLRTESFGRAFPRPSNVDRMLAGSPLQRIAGAIAAGDGCSDWAEIDVKLLPDLVRQGWELRRPVAMMRAGSRDLIELTQQVDPATASAVEGVLARVLSLEQPPPQTNATGSNDDDERPRPPDGEFCSPAAAAGAAPKVAEGFSRPSSSRTVLCRAPSGSASLDEKATREEREVKEGAPVLPPPATMKKVGQLQRTVSEQTSITDFLDHHGVGATHPAKAQAEALVDQAHALDDDRRYTVLQTIAEGDLPAAGRILFTTLQQSSLFDDPNDGETGNASARTLVCPPTHFRRFASDPIRFDPVEYTRRGGTNGMADCETVEKAEEEETCAVCRCGISPASEPAMCLNGHKMHAGCLMQHLMSDTRCPTCRVPFHFPSVEPELKSQSQARAGAFSGMEVRMCPNEACFKQPRAAVIRHACADLATHHGQCEQCHFTADRSAIKRIEAEYKGERETALARGQAVDTAVSSVESRIPTCPRHATYPGGRRRPVTFNGCLSCGRVFPRQWTDLPLHPESHAQDLVERLDELEKTMEATHDSISFRALRDRAEQLEYEANAKSTTYKQLQQRARGLKRRGPAPDPAEPFQRGTFVRVRATVETPRGGWGFVHRQAVGTVVRIDGRGPQRIVVVNFPGGAPIRPWFGRADEMELCAGPASAGPAFPRFLRGGVSATTAASDAPALPDSMREGAYVRVVADQPRFGWPNTAHLSATRRDAWRVVQSRSLGLVRGIGAQRQGHRLVKIGFPGCQGLWTCAGTDLEVCDAPPRDAAHAVGDLVRVRSSIVEPSCGWDDGDTCFGTISHASVGVVRELRADGMIRVVWPEHVVFQDPDEPRSWVCLPGDVEASRAFGGAEVELGEAEQARVRKHRGEAIVHFGFSFALPHYSRQPTAFLAGEPASSDEVVPPIPAGMNAVDDWGPAEDDEALPGGFRCLAFMDTRWGERFFPARISAVHAPNGGGPTEYSTRLDGGEVVVRRMRDQLRPMPPALCLELDAFLATRRQGDSASRTTGEVDHLSQLLNMGGALANAGGAAGGAAAALAMGAAIRDAFGGALGDTADTADHDGNDAPPQCRQG